MNAVNFAIVGLGFGASRVELFGAVPGANLVAVVDADAARAEEVGRRHNVSWSTDVDDVLKREDVDVVGIYTPSGMHRDVALAAAQAGKHLLMTKPLEVSLERIDEILLTAKQCGVEVFAEFYLRYEPDHYRMHQAIAGGLIGPPILGDFAFKCYRPQWYFDMGGGWRGTKEFNGGGIMMNQAIHFVDLLYWHLGDVAEVQATAGTFAHQIEVEDTAAAVLRMRSGAIATFVGTTTFQTRRCFYEPYGGGSLTRAEINGPRGSVSIVDDVLGEVVLEPGTELPGLVKPPNVLADVVAALADPAYRSPALVRGDEARKSVEIVDALYRAAATGERVAVGTGR
ncbi:MAG TPA: Gfo/Idh/MocA family oxidoreductase [Streptosporangiaceae bacterium]